jgi:hypothetical protein
MEYFYHYTTAKNAEEILKNGLQPRRSLIGMNNEGDAANLGSKLAIFGLPSPAPENWLRCEVRAQTSFNDYSILEDLLNAVAWRSPTKRSRKGGDVVLLKVRLLPGDDVYVSDFGRIWKAQGDVDDCVVDDYCNSLTKFHSDFDIAAKKLPEIICFNAIPADRIECVETIPFDKISAYIGRKNGDPEEVPSQQLTARPKKIRRLMARLVNHLA